jgi:hypothetical protein
LSRPRLAGHGDRFGSVPHLEFGEDVGDVVGDGLSAEAGGGRFGRCPLRRLRARGSLVRGGQLRELDLTTAGATRVALYLRISTDEDHQPLSLGAQETRLAAFVTSQPG